MLWVICARVRFGSITPSSFKTDAVRHFGGRNSFHCTRRRSSSLNFISHSCAFCAFWRFKACCRKKLMTRVSDSVASMQYANPPIASCSGSPLAGSLSTIFGLLLLKVLLSEMPKNGARTSYSFSQRAPSQGSRRLTSALVRLRFHPVDTLQNRSIRKTVQNTLRRSSACH